MPSPNARTCSSNPPFTQTDAGSPAAADASAYVSVRKTFVAVPQMMRVVSAAVTTTPGWSRCSAAVNHSGVSSSTVSGRGRPGSTVTDGVLMARPFVTVSYGCGCSLGFEPMTAGAASTDAEPVGASLGCRASRCRDLSRRQVIRHQQCQELDGADGPQGNGERRDGQQDHRRILASVTEREVDDARAERLGGERERRDHEQRDLPSALEQRDEPPREDAPDERRHRVHEAEEERITE